MYAGRSASFRRNRSCFTARSTTICVTAANRRRATTCARRLDRVPDRRGLAPAQRLGHGLGALGVGLSGGEKQRVAITRALLQRRPILILDEATSALDAPTEHRILSRLERWCAGRIVIVVSHRLSAARWATRVVVMHRGEIVEDGTHDSLYRPGTHYYACGSVPNIASRGWWGPLVRLVASGRPHHGSGQSPRRPEPTTRTRIGEQAAMGRIKQGPDPFSSDPSLP